MKVQAFAHTIVDLSPYGKVVDITIKGDPEQEEIAKKKGIEKLRAATRYLRTKIPQIINTADNFAVEINKEFVKKLRDPKTKKQALTAHTSMEFKGLLEASELLEISAEKTHESKGNAFADYFVYFRTYFRLWEQVYSAKLNVGVRTESNLEVLNLYAITDIKMV